MSSVTAISVAYNSVAVLPGLVESMAPGLPMILVDNGPDDGLRDWAKRRGIPVLVPGGNLGFGSGCNLGAAQTASDFVLFINPDARLEPGALDQLLQAAELHPDATAFGPVLVNDAGQIRYKRNSYLLPRTRKPPRDPGLLPRSVPVLSGAVLLIRSVAFETVGGFDPGIFLYFEDDDLSLRLRQSAGPLMLVPAARAHHVNGHSSPASPALSRFKGYHWTRSRIYAGRKHGLRFAWGSGLWDAVSHCLSPKSWRNPEHRNEGIGRLHGALTMLAKKPPASHNQPRKH